MPHRSTLQSSTRRLTCGDATGNSGGATPCRFAATGPNDADVLQQVLAHAKNEHGVAVTPALLQTAKAAIRKG